MPDISMCCGESSDGSDVCPMRADCHRYTASPDKHRQSYFAVLPLASDGSCAHYWNNAGTCGTRPIVDWPRMAALGAAFENAARVVYAFDLGHRSVTLVHDGWHPGCGLPATQASIGCTWCGTLYKAFNLEHKTGDNCAASARCKDGVWRVVGHYGSGSHDMRVYRVNRNKDLFAGRDGKGIAPICDLCIDSLIADGNLSRDITDHP